MKIKIEGECAMADEIDPQLQELQEIVSPIPGATAEAVQLGRRGPREQAAFNERVRGAYNSDGTPRQAAAEPAPQRPQTQATADAATPRETRRAQRAPLTQTTTAPAAATTDAPAASTGLVARSSEITGPRDYLRDLNPNEVRAIQTARA